MCRKVSHLSHPQLHRGEGAGTGRSSDLPPTQPSLGSPATCWEWALVGWCTDQEAGFRAQREQTAEWGPQSTDLSPQREVTCPVKQPHSPLPPSTPAFDHSRALLPHPNLPSSVALAQPPGHLGSPACTFYPALVGAPHGSEPPVPSAQTALPREPWRRLPRARGWGETRVCREGLRRMLSFISR